MDTSDNHQNNQQKTTKKTNLIEYGLSLLILVIVAVGAFVFAETRTPKPLFSNETSPLYQLLSDKLKADTRAYISSLPSSQKPAVSEMKSVATERKAEMLKMAESNPDAFLVNAVAPEEKAVMPESVQAEVEQSVETEALYQGDTVVIDNKTYKLDYNRTVPLYINPNSKTKFKGYILGDHFVIPATSDGYEENTISTTTEKPGKNVTFEAGAQMTESAGGVLSGTTGTDGTGTVIPGVPAYLWHDGCGPTAVGMVLGYYDGHGYPNIIPGDATTQNSTVNQIIASHSAATGQKRHYEDYALPKEASGATKPLTDKSAPPAGDEHVSDSIADFMHTSWSSDGLLYGWSFSSKLNPAFNTYFTRRYPSTPVTGATYAGTSLTFSLLKQEVNAKRPMVFLVDTDGNGASDHLVTVIGYRVKNGVNQYASWDTWSTTLRWQNFRPMSTAYTWGIWGGSTFIVNPPTPVPAPTITSFTATPTSIQSGQAATLSWTSTGTNTLSINQGVGSVTATGSKTVMPTVTTTYTLTAANSAGSVSKTVTVTVSPQIVADTTPPVVSISGSNKLVNGGTYSSGTYTVTASATDASGISTITIYLGDKPQVSCASIQCSFTFDMSTLQSGTYTIKAVAYDKANPANSAYNTLTFNRAPIVTVQSSGSKRH